MSHMEDGAFNFLCKEIGKTVENPERLNLNSARLTRLRRSLEPDKARIKYLTSSRKNAGNKRKRQVVRQSGQGLGLLIGALAPVLIGLVKDFIKRRK